MKSNQSYVISAAMGSGFYRHIRISAGATFYQLHKAIMEAFCFYDDQGHIFFLDNDLEGDHCCGSEDLEDMPSSQKIHLNESLKAGRKFKYLFDREEEWIFQCYVVKFMGESTETPVVIRAQGKPVKQHPDDEKADEPPIFDKKDLKELYGLLKMPQETVDMVHQYFLAMAHLYGIIPLRKALEIINTQNPPMDEAMFEGLTQIIRHERQPYAILGREELHEGIGLSDPMDRELVVQYVYAVDLDDYRALKEHQEGKPYYIPPKDIFLLYAAEGFQEETFQSKAMRRFLIRKMKMVQDGADALLEMLFILLAMDTPVPYILDILTEEKVIFFRERQVEEFVSLLIHLHNNSRKHVNRGHTPEELSRLLPSYGPYPKSIEFGPGIAKAVREGQIDVDEMIQGFQKMGIPSEELEANVVRNLENLRPEKQMKIGRNDPCPCGSGRKYKHCCGR